MVNNVASIKAVISAVDNASGTIRGVADNTRKSSAVMKAAIAGVGLVLGKFLKDSVLAFQESQDAIAQTNNVLKSTKGIAGVTADEVERLSKELQNQTRFSDEAVRQGQNLLLTFTKIGKDVFPEATETILDMSTALGQDVKSSAIQLGKALQDPILGITALRRVGVNFNEQQKETVKRLVETGKHAEAQRFILKELRTEFGGSAKAAGETFGGQVDKLKNQLNDLQEQIGGLIIKYLQPMVEWLLKNEGAVKVLLIALGVLAGAVVFNAIATAFTTAFGVARGAVVGVIGVVKGLGLLLATPMVMPAIVVAAAIASIFSVKKAVDSVRGAIQAMSNQAKAAENLVKGQLAVSKSLNKSVNQGKIDLATLYKTQQSLGLPSTVSKQNIGGMTTYLPTFDTGGVVPGPKGSPQMVMAHAGETILPTHKKQSGIGSTINLNVNVGMYAGSEMEKRKIAKALYQSLQDAMGPNFGMAL